jgi:hypothetical protein
MKIESPKAGQSGADTQQLLKRELKKRAKKEKLKKRAKKREAKKES